jgi:hypothetical protein
MAPVVPLPLALPVAWLIGLSMAWSARNELARSEVHLLLARPFLLAAAVLSIIVLLAVVFFGRLVSSATYAQFHGGFGTAAIGKSSLGRGVLSSWTALLAGWGWAIHVLRRK